jgi:hypothetical protein
MMTKIQDLTRAAQTDTPALSRPRASGPGAFGVSAQMTITAGGLWSWWPNTNLPRGRGSSGSSAGAAKRALANEDGEAVPG